MTRERPFKSRDDLDGKRWKRLGPAERLLDFLKDRQTSPSGDVWYHKEISYAWIRSKIPNAPPERTLKRWMQRLREAGEAAISRTAYGMRVRLVNSRKWARQTSLFPPPAVARFRKPSAAAAGNLSAMPVEKPVEYDFSEVPKVAPETGQKWPTKEGLEKTIGTSNPPRARRADHSPAWRQEQKAKRLLREISMVHEVYAGIGPGDPDGIARRDYKLDQLYGQLRQMGYTDEVSGQRETVRAAVSDLARRKAMG